MLVFLLQKKQELQMYCLERDNGKVETVHFIVAQISWERVHVVTLSDISLHATLKFKIKTNINWFSNHQQLIRFCKNVISFLPFFVVPAT